MTTENFNNEKKPNKRGAKPIEVDLAQVERCAELGMKEEAIAYFLGMHPSTWYDKKSKNNDISEAIKRGKSKSQQKLLAELERRTAADMNPASLFFALKALHQFRDAPTQLEISGANGTPLQIDHAVITPEERRIKIQELKMLEEADED